MTQQKIQVQQWWTPSGGKVGIVTTPDQFKWYVYDKTLFPLMVVGSEIECDVDADKKNDKGEPRPTILSIVGRKTLESNPPIVKPPVEGKGYKADPDKTASIERQVSLKTAVELAVAKIIEIDQVISFATVFGMYLSGEFSESESEIIAKYLAKYKKGVK